MVNLETTILFTAPPLPGVEAGDRVRVEEVEIEGFATGVCYGEFEGALSGASGEVVDAIAGGEVLVDGKGVVPPKHEMKTVLKLEELQ